MPHLHLIDEAIGLLNTEIRLIEWRIKYPEQLKQRIENKPFSPLISLTKQPYQHHGNGSILSHFSLFLHNCQLLIIFCHRTYEPGATEDNGFR